MLDRGLLEDGGIGELRRAALQQSRWENTACQASEGYAMLIRSIACGLEGINKGYLSNSKAKTLQIT